MILFKNFCIKWCERAAAKCKSLLGLI